MASITGELLETGSKEAIKVMSGKDRERITTAKKNSKLVTGKVEFWWKTKPLCIMKPNLQHKTKASLFYE